MWACGPLPAPAVPTDRCEAPKPRHISTTLRQSSGVPCDVSRRPSMPNVLGSRPASAQPAVDSVHGRLPAALERPQWQKAVGDLRRALDRGFGARADPDRDGLLNGPRVDASRVDRVERPFERDHALGPQPAHELDLLFEAPRASPESACPAPRTRSGSSRCQRQGGACHRSRRRGRRPAWRSSTVWRCGRMTTLVS